MATHLQADTGTSSATGKFYLRDTDESRDGMSLAFRNAGSCVVYSGTERDWCLLTCSRPSPWATS